MLKDLQITFEEEKAAEHDKLETQYKMDIEHLKAGSEGKVQAEKKKLQEEKLNCFKKEVVDFCYEKNSNKHVNSLGHLYHFVALRFYLCAKRSVAQRGGGS